MYPSRTVTMAVDRPLQHVYEFLADPENLPRWTQVPPHGWRKVSTYAWQADGQDGAILIRFTPPNRFGILDIVIEGAPVGSQAVPARVYANGEGCEVAVTLFQREGLSKERFESDCAWVEADLQVLKTYLESLKT